MISYRTLNDLVEELCDARAVDEQSKSELIDCVDEIKRIIDNYMYTGAEIHGAAKVLRAINSENDTTIDCREEFRKMLEDSADSMRYMAYAVKCLSDFALKVQTGEKETNGDNNV